MLNHGARIVTDGLVLYLDAANPKSYPGFGTTWKDLSGNGNDGTLVNGVGYDSANNGSLVFDGVDDVVDFHFQYSSTYSLAVWIRFTGPTGGNRAIVDMGVGISNSVRFYLQGEKVKIQHGSGFAENGVFSSEDVVTNLYAQYLVTFSGGQCRLYKNSELDNTGTLGNPNTDLLNIAIGNHPTGNGSGINNLQCDFGLLQIYNRALTESEIKQNFNALRGRYGV